MLSSSLYTRPRCLHAAQGSKRRQLHGLRPHCLYPVSQDAPSRRYTLGERRACSTWSIRCRLFAPHPPEHEHRIISAQRGPGCDIDTRQRESVFFARDDMTTVLATSVWPGRALMCSCRASRASHVVFSHESLPLCSWQHLACSTPPSLLPKAETRGRHTLPKAGGLFEKSSLTSPNPRSEHQAPSSVVCASSSRPPVCPCPHEPLHHDSVAFVYRDQKGTLALRILRENKFKDADFHDTVHNVPEAVSVDASAARTAHARPLEVVHASRFFAKPTEPQLHGVVQLLKQRCALQEHDPRGVHGAGAAAAEREREGERVCLCFSFSGLTSFGLAGAHCSRHRVQAVCCSSP